MTGQGHGQGQGHGHCQGHGQGHGHSHGQSHGQGHGQGQVIADKMTYSQNKSISVVKCRLCGKSFCSKYPRKVFCNQRCRWLYNDVKDKVAKEQRQKVSGGVLYQRWGRAVSRFRENPFAHEG